MFVICLGEDCDLPARDINDRWFFSAIALVHYNHISTFTVITFLSVNVKHVTVLSVWSPDNLSFAIFGVPEAEFSKLCTLLIADATSEWDFFYCAFATPLRCFIVPWYLEIKCMYGCFGNCTVSLQTNFRINVKYSTFSRFTFCVLPICLLHTSVY